eukprot:3730704-Pyramimonas_sp.AAC.1
MLCVCLECVSQPFGSFQALRWRRTHNTGSYSIYMVCGAPATSRSSAADWNVLGGSDSESSERPQEERAGSEQLTEPRHRIAEWRRFARYIKRTAFKRRLWANIGQLLLELKRRREIYNEQIDFEINNGGPRQTGAVTLLAAAESSARASAAGSTES